MAGSNERINVPMEVNYPGAWLSWVSAVTGCLNALGVECDMADVAGQSGYAFHTGIAPDLCPSGPTVLDWDGLNWGPRALGRSTSCFYSGECFTGEYRNDRTRAHAREAFEFAKREIEGGRPCVMWGAYVPEFAVCYGIEGDAYLVKSFKKFLNEPEPPIAWDEIDAPGGPYVLAFPTPTEFDQRRKDKEALINAVRYFKFEYRPYAHGEAAYDLWADALKAKRAHSMGNAYCCACYAEGRAFAGKFIKRVAERNEFAREELEESAAKLTEAELALIEMVKLFPFPGEADKKVVDDEAIGKAVEYLEEAKKADAKAMKLIEKVARMDWPKE